jgi:tRNA 2-thiocytidine biosynthesis protein TtcA
MLYEGSRITRAERRIVGRAGDLIERFGLVGEGDRVMVCVSGGKDSYALLDVLRILALRAPVRFELVAVHLDQGWEGSHHAEVARWLAGKGIEYHVVRRDHASVIEEKLSSDTIPCSLCSRLRRGALYGVADEIGCAKLALGHHLDDAIDSLMLNMFHNGRLAALPPMLRARDGRHRVIRPLLAVPEAEILEMARSRGYPVVRCTCPFVCTSTGERLRVRAIIDELQRFHPRIRDSLRSALSNVQTEFLWASPRGASPPAAERGDDAGCE